MVEALKIAVQKARAMRARADSMQQPDMAAVGNMDTVPPGTAVDIPVPEALPPDHEAVWAGLKQVRLSQKHLERTRLISHARNDPAHAAFDVLRTKIQSVFAKKGWTRLGISSPGKGCGKTFVSANLAFSLARQSDCRTLLMDMDLRAPGLARMLGVAEAVPINWLLKDEVDPEAFLLRHDQNLALALNSEQVRDASETVQATRTSEVLLGLQTLLKPTITIYDLPPMLVCDDVMGFLPQLDCVLLVAGGGKTRAADVTECERMLTDQTELLGVLLNQAEGVSSTQYGYGYGSV